MIWDKLSKYQDIGLLVARLGIGLGLLFFHGWGKLIEGPERWKGVGGAMSNFGIDFGHTFFGFLASFSESVGGLLIAAGLFFRPRLADHNECRTQTQDTHPPSEDRFPDLPR